jgi:hypothetical protein
MSLQMQLRRGVIALAFGLALAVFALGHGHVEAAAARGVGSVIRAVDRPAGCGDSLRIEIARDLRVTVGCAAACAPMQRVLGTLHVATTAQPRCAPAQTA